MTSRWRMFVTLFLVVTMVGWLGAPMAWAQGATAPPAPPAAPGAESVIPGAQTVPGTPAPSPAGTQPGPQQLSPSPLLDRMLARWIILGNQEEIAVSQFAQQHAQADAVKKFAQKMVQEHNEFVDRLQQVALATAGQRAGSPTSAGAAVSGGEPMGTSTTQPGTAGGAGAAGMPGQSLQRALEGHEPLLALAQQVGQRRIQLIQQELQRQQGPSFDAAFIGQQVEAHLSMLATLQTFQPYASANPQFQQLVTQGIQTTEQHLNQARDLMNQLQQQMAATAQRQGSQQR